MAKRKKPPADPLAAALEDALVANPDDLAAHAAYADWLTDHDDPRGEFIQVQLALEDPRLPPDERGRLQDRERALLAAHRDTWLGSLAGTFPPEAEPRQFARFARGWIDSVRVNRLDVQQARRFSNARELRLLRSLVILGCDPEPEVWGYAAGVGEALRYPGLSALPFARYLGNLRCFGLGDVEGDFQYCTFPDASHLPAVLARMPKLRELHLNTRRLDLSALLDTPVVLGLHTLRLERVHLFDEGAGELAKRKWPRLRVLQIWNGRVGDEGANALARSKWVRGLERLDVSFNHLTEAGVGRLKAAGVPLVAEYQTRPEDYTDDEFEDDGWGGEGEDEGFDIDLE